MSYLYDTDILLWSKQQAELLRRQAAGKRVHDAAIDWPNIVEAIEEVGQTERHSLDSPLVRYDARGHAGRYLGSDRLLNGLLVRIRRRFFGQCAGTDQPFGKVSSSR